MLKSYSAVQKCSLWFYAQKVQCSGKVQESYSCKNENFIIGDFVCATWVLTDADDWDVVYSGSQACSGRSNDA